MTSFVYCPAAIVAALDVARRTFGKDDQCWCGDQDQLTWLEDNFNLWADWVEIHPSQLGHSLRAIHVSKNPEGQVDINGLVSFLKERGWSKPLLVPGDMQLPHGNLLATGELNLDIVQPAEFVQSHSDDLTQPSGYMLKRETVKCFHVEGDARLVVLEMPGKDGWRIRLLEIGRGLSPQNRSGMIALCESWFEHWAELTYVSSVFLPDIQLLCLEDIHWLIGLGIGSQGVFSGVYQLVRFQLRSGQSVSTQSVKPFRLGRDESEGGTDWIMRPPFLLQVECDSLSRPVLQAFIDEDSLVPLPTAEQG